MSANEPATAAEPTEALATAAATAESLGRLTDWGLREPWHVALLLPDGFDDFSVVHADASAFADAVEITVSGTVCSRATTQFSNLGRGPQTKLEIELIDGTRVHATWFGDSRQVLAGVTQGDTMIVSGALRALAGRWYLAVRDRVEQAWAGRCRPRYPRMGTVMSDARMRARVLALLREHLDEAARGMQAEFEGLATPAEVLAAAHPPQGIDTLQRLIVRAHCPQTQAKGEEAIKAMERYAALVMVKRLLQQHLADQGKERAALPIDLKTIVKEWPFPPTPSQWKAITQMEAVFARPRAAMMLLTGDVGSGKTLCYLTLATGVARCGGRVAILMPNTVLAQQVHAEQQRVFADVPMALVTGASVPDNVAEAQIIIGTTALLTRLDRMQLDLVITDEQQKMGAEQRRALLQGSTHVLDVTATAIPRTLALARFGIIETAHIKRSNREQTIKTTLWRAWQMSTLYAMVRETVAAGDRVLVVYPAIKEGKAMRSVEASISKWQAAFPDRVRVLTGKLKDVEVSKNLGDLVEGRADIGICTSIVEVGINVPRLRRLVVVHPERFGLTTLHQMRGRLAREGGHGAFDMLLMKEPKPKTIERLTVLEALNDGDAIAREDLRLRGPGELAADGVRQSGGAAYYLFQRELATDCFEGAEPTVRGWMRRAGWTD